ncbi:MAG: glycosyltransferase family 4 protein [Candidatus ainarchaeum sp.]|nr:glycosyltransferase family 4 protein [Candidatus ainarchaeum sp.]
MRLAIVTPYLVGRAGGERHALDLAYNLGKLGNEVELFCYAANRETCFGDLMARVKVRSIVPERGRSAHAEIHSRKGFFNKYFRFLRPYYELLMMRRLGNGIPAGFDAILCTNQPSEWAGWFAKRRTHAPVVWNCNEPPFYHDARIRKGILFAAFGWPVYKIWDVKAARSLDKFISLSRLYKKYVDRTYGVDSLVVHIGADPPVAKPAWDIRRKYGLKEGAFIVLFVGTFVGYKRPQDAVGAVSRVPGTELFLVGEGSEEQGLRALARKLGVDERVHFVSRLSDSELESFYAQCDALVFTAEQSWGLVIPEAMLRGKPVITCLETGASEIVEDGKTGFIVPPRDPEAIARKLAFLKSTPEAGKRIGKSARAWAEKHMSQEECAKRVERVLRSALRK